MTIITQHRERATAADKRYSKINARLIDAEQTLHQVSQELNEVQKVSDVALGRN